MEENVYKNVITKIGLTGLTNVIIGLSAIILLPVLTKNLSISEYGIWIQISVTTSLLSSIIVLGLHGSLVRFMATYTNKKDIQEGFYSIFLIVFIIGLIVSVTFYLLSTQIASILFDNNVLITRMIPLIMLMTALNAINVNFFRAFNQIRAYNIFLLTNTILQVIIVYYFVVFGYGIWGATLGLIISQIMYFFIMFIPIFQKIQFKLPRFTKIKEYLSFSIPLVPTDLYSWAVKLSDRYIIGILLGIAFVGYYSPSYTLSNIILMISTPITIILFPTLSKHFDDGNLEIVENILSYSLKYFLACAIPAAVGLSILSKQILLLLTTPDIASAGYIITPFVTTSAILFGAYGIIVQIIYFKNKTKLLLLIWSLAGILNIGLNILFLPHMGLIGAGISTLIAYLIAFISTLYYSFKYFSFEIELVFIIKSIISSILMSSFILLLNPSGFLNILIVIFSSALLYLIVLYLLKGFKTEEIIFLKGLLK